MHRDRRPVTERAGERRRLAPLRHKIAKHCQGKIRMPGFDVFKGNPGLKRPPRPDQAAEGRRKPGLFPSIAPLATQASNARKASRVFGKSLGTPSPVSPVEVMPTDFGEATNTG